jgi:dTDP-4-dehydrorhamnose reductase
MRLIFVSTDGVLPGLNGSYTEVVEQSVIMSESPVAQYTNAKLEAERFIMSSIHNYCIIRVGPIYGCSISGVWDQRIASMLDSFEKKKTITRATNILRTFIHVQDLASAICELAVKDIQGICHLGPKKSESYFEFSLEVAKAFGHNIDLIFHHWFLKLKQNQDKYV